MPLGTVPMHWRVPSLWRAVPQFERMSRVPGLICTQPPNHLPPLLVSGSLLHQNQRKASVLALVVDGGVGVAKNLVVGGVTNCLDTTASTWHATNPLTGSLLVEGGLAVRTNIVGASASLHGGTAATSTTTGALVVTGGIGVDGNVFCNNTYNMSDIRLKTNVEVIDNALDRVCSMRGCTFDWNDRMTGLTGTKSVGVIAQEVKDHAPLCVAHNPETDLYAVGPGRGEQNKNQTAPKIVLKVGAVYDRGHQDSEKEV